jgi:hypothetical protein
MVIPRRRPAELRAGVAGRGLRSRVMLIRPVAGIPEIIGEHRLGGGLADHGRDPIRAQARGDQGAAGRVGAIERERPVVVTAGPPECDISDNRDLVRQLGHRPCDPFEQILVDSHMAALPSGNIDLLA